MNGLMSNDDKQIYSLLGICKKAGCIKAGEFMTEKTSDNTKKKFRNMTDFYNVPYREFGNKDGLGNCIGCEFRASLAVTNKGLADKLIEKISNIVK